MQSKLFLFLLFNIVVYCNMVKNLFFPFIQIKTDNIHHKTEMEINLNLGSFFSWFFDGHFNKIDEHL